jgi:capsular exopolysaccharide synthesis family protein
VSSADQLIRVLLRRKWTVIVTFLVVLAGAAAVTFALPKVYSTQALVLVDTSRPGADAFQATQANQLLTSTYANLLSTRNTANAVAARLPYKASGASVDASVDVSPLANTQLIEVSAEAGSAREAQILANTYARYFVSQTSRVAPAGAAGAKVSAQPASLPAGPSRPRPTLYLIVGAILAAFVAVGIALLRQRFDQRLEVDSATTELHGVPVLARVPRQDREVRELAGTKDSAATSSVSEAFRLLLANLSFVNFGSRPQVIAVVSAGSSDGKSTASIGIARAAVEAGVNAVVVDADLRRPNIAPSLGVDASRSAGLSTMLLDPELADDEDVIIDLPGALPQIVPSGPLPPNPAALLGSPRLGEAIARLREQYDLVILDTPPVSVGADASLVSAVADGVVIVVDASKTRRDDLDRSIDQLRRTQVNLLGVVLNRSARIDSDYSYYTAEKGGRGSRGGRGGRRGGRAPAQMAASNGVPDVLPERFAGPSPGR